MTMSIGLPSPSLVIAASATLPAICVLTTILRFWARRLNKVKLMLDDWLILPALLLLISMGATLITGVHLKAFTFPKPSPDSPDPSNYQVSLSTELQWVSQMMQVLHLGFVKLSFIFLFRRIFLVNKYSTFGIASLVTIIVIISWTLAFFLTFLFACRGSFSAWWVPLHTTCIATVLFEETFVISDFVMDLIIVMMPMPMVWQMTMNNNRKVAVTAVFALGSVAVVASLIRLIVFVQAYSVVFKGVLGDALSVTEATYWSMIESCLASIAVCLPVLHGLFRKISLKAVICSVRSITPRGLTLVGLQGSRASNTATARIKSDNNSTSSHARILPSHLETTTVEVYAMRDCSTTPENQMVPQGEILVGSTVTQSQYTA